MVQFLLAIPPIVLYGCGILIGIAIAMSIALFWQTRRVRSQLRILTHALDAFRSNSPSRNREGLSLKALSEIQSQCAKLGDAPRGWWTVIDSHIEQYTSIEKYTSPGDVEGWFLTENPREILPYDIVISKQFHSAFFSAFPGLLTGAGLTLTFVAILLALYGVHYDKTNTVDPISGVSTRSSTGFRANFSARSSRWS
jgi:hypothetical protein